MSVPEEVHCCSSSNCIVTEFGTTKNKSGKGVGGTAAENSSNTCASGDSKGDRETRVVQLETGDSCRRSDIHGSKSSESSRKNEAASCKGGHTSSGSSRQATTAAVTGVLQNLNNEAGLESCLKKIDSNTAQPYLRSSNDTEAYCSRSCNVNQASTCESMRNMQTEGENRVAVGASIAHSELNEKKSKQAGSHVELISSEGATVVVEGEVAAQCEFFRKVLRRNEEGHPLYTEGSTAVITLPSIRKRILEKVVEYLRYRRDWYKNGGHNGIFYVESDIALELLFAANYLGLSEDDPI